MPWATVGRFLGALPISQGIFDGRKQDLLFELELVNHFEIEEQILFPAIENALGKLSLVASLIAQHREVEEIVAQLRSAPTAALLERLCGLLAEHIRREENDLFQVAQSRLPEPILRELGAAIERKVVRICL